MDQEHRAEIEARTFRRLLAHLQTHTEVQNIDLMIAADFCRNCLAKWYKAAADEIGEELPYPEALAAIYGMSYEEWKTRFQTEATPEQLQRYEEKQKRKPA
ncbi:DUF1244 domain-containing protein [Methylococcus geothermalis]|uniref:DUF1244 domain-containing protein n=1 Tax=Methylococcus geothermalis TaxID=2681310 RepID=A0A858Q7N0_9GAMM|nr:DUF1244 domain-containing protein [Methylococcus geothermalis]QJD29827.1 DUF1244 domain-containing protein [Methylococcus geothermalis]